MVLIEAVHSGTLQPEFVDWDPTVVNAGITLIDDEEADDGANPLQLRWIEKPKVGGFDLVTEPDVP